MEGPNGTTGFEVTMSEAGSEEINRRRSALIERLESSSRLRLAALHAKRSIVGDAPDTGAEGFISATAVVREKRAFAGLETHDPDANMTGTTDARVVLLMKQREGEVRRTAALEMRRARATRLAGRYAHAQARPGYKAQTNTTNIVTASVRLNLAGVDAAQPVGDATSARFNGTVCNAEPVTESGAGAGTGSDDGTRSSSSGSSPELALPPPVARRGAGVITGPHLARQLQAIARDLSRPTQRSSTALVYRAPHRRMRAGSSLSSNGGAAAGTGNARDRSASVASEASQPGSAASEASAGCASSGLTVLTSPDRYHARQRLVYNNTRIPSFVGGNDEATHTGGGGEGHCRDWPLSPVYDGCLLSHRSGASGFDPASAWGTPQSAFGTRAGSGCGGGGSASVSAAASPLRSGGATGGIRTGGHGSLVASPTAFALTPPRAFSRSGTTGAVGSAPVSGSTTPVAACSSGADDSFGNGSNDRGAIGGVAAQASPMSPSTRHQLAEVKRTLTLQGVVASAKAADAARQSRRTLSVVEARRTAIQDRIGLTTGLASAAARRESELQRRRAAAQARGAKVAASSGRVKAARRLQCWFRFRRLLALGEKQDVADAQLAAARTEGSESGVQPSPAMTPVATPSMSAAAKAGTPRNNIAQVPAPASEPQSPTSTARGITRRVLPIVSSPPLQKAFAIVLNAISGTPTLDDGTRLNGVDSVATLSGDDDSEEESQGGKSVGARIEAGGTADAPAARAAAADGVTGGPAPAASVASAAASDLPFPDFETCAAAIQQRGVVAAAQALASAVARAYQTADAGGLLVPQGEPPATSESGAATRAPGTGSDWASHLRPTAARSGRTLLAALMVAYYSEEILSASGGSGGEAIAVDHGHSVTTGGSGSGPTGTGAGAGSGGAHVSEHKKARDRALLAASRRMLACLHALCRAFLVDQSVVCSAGTPEGRAALFGLSDVQLDGNLATSPHLTGELVEALAVAPAPAPPAVSTGTGTGSTTSTPAPSLPASAASSSAAADPAHALHVLWSFNSAWCGYMDAFLAWKSGDSAVLAQALARPFRQLLGKQAQLDSEAQGTIGRGDAGLGELREGTTAHISLLHAQLVALLGPKRADQWEADQRASFAAEQERDRRLGVAPPAPVRARTAATAAAAAGGATPVAAAAASGASGASTPNATGTSARSPSLGAAAGPEVPRSAQSAPRAALFRSVMSNEALAHELIVDPGFRLPEPLVPADLGFAGEASAAGDAGDASEGSVSGGGAGGTGGDTVTETYGQPALHPPLPMLAGSSEEFALDGPAAAAPAVHPASSSGAAFTGTAPGAGPSLPEPASAEPRSRSASISARPPLAPATGASISSSAGTGAGIATGLPGITPPPSVITAASTSIAPVLSPLVKAAPAVSPHITRLVAQVTAGATSGVRNSGTTGGGGGPVPGSSPLLRAALAGPGAGGADAFSLSPAHRGAPPAAVASAAAGGSPTPYRAPIPAATGTGALPGRTVTRNRYRGQVRYNGDPAQLRVSPAFWDAMLRAAQARADEEWARDTAAGRVPFASVQHAVALRGVTGPDGGGDVDTPSSGHPAVDAVCTSLLSVRDALISLVPHRVELHPQIGGFIEGDFFSTLLRRGAVSHSDWLKLLRHIARVITDLEAPARNESTRAWVAEAEAHVRRLTTRQLEAAAAAGRAKRVAAGSTPILSPALTALLGMQAASSGGAGVSRTECPTAAAADAGPAASGTGAGSAASLLPPAVIDDDVSSLLPRLLAWAHWKVALIRLDISNAQLASLAPYLQVNGRGAEYERGRFEAAVQDGRAGTEGLRAWLQQALVSTQTVVASATAGTTASGGGPVSSSAGGGTGSGAHTPHAVAGLPLTSDYLIARLALLRDGFVSILGYEHAVTTIAQVAAQARPPDGIVRLRYSSADEAGAPSADGGVMPQASASGASGGASPASATSTGAAGALFASFAFPETLQLDARRLTEAQNVVQRVALIATLSALVSQVAATAPPLAAIAPGVPPSHPALGRPQSDVQSARDFEAQARAWLQDESVSLTDLTTGSLAAADAMARMAGRVPLLVASASAITGADANPAVAAQIAAVRELATRLGATLQAAVAKAVSTAHPLYATMQRRVLEVVRRRITRRVQDALPPGVDARYAHEFPAWGACLDPVGAPLPPLLASAVPPCCAEDVGQVSADVARLVRHHEAAYGGVIKGLLAAHDAIARGAASAPAAGVAIAAVHMGGDSDLQGRVFISAADMGAVE